MSNPAKARPSRSTWSPDFSHSNRCAGYYFVRLFINRLENIDPDFDESPGGWRTIWHYPTKAARPTLLAAAIKFWVQYRRDQRVSQLVGLGPDVAVDGPDLLVGGSPQNGRCFSNIPAVEEAFRLEYHQHEEVRRVVDNLRTVSDAIPEPTMTRPEVETAMALAGHGTDEIAALGDANEAKYAEETMDRFPSDKYRYVLMGHTHYRMERQIRAIIYLTHRMRGA
jgi:hypothetical protein